MARSMPAAMILSQISRLACGGKESGTECARYSIVFEVHPGLDLHAALVQPPRGVAGVHAGPPCQRWQPALDFGMTETGTFADDADDDQPQQTRSEEHTSELQSLRHLVCRLLLEKKNR